MTQDFYRAFEDQHRGARADIQQRLRIYLPFLRALRETAPEGLRVLDVGCGRGEWLELLRSEGLQAQGVDLDDGMLAACRERGLDVQRADAVAFLGELPAASLHAVSGFHIAEHLPFEVLQALIAQALRVLVPGGLLILETPNPENLVVGSCSFYLDPTHQRPLPSALLAFLAEHQGFETVKVLRLQEAAGLAGRERLTLMDVLGGASPDYAVVARTPGGATVPALQACFDSEFGVALNALAERYDLRLREDIHWASTEVAKARQESRAAHDTAERCLQALQALQGRFALAQQQAQQALTHAEEARREMAALQASWLWRVGQLLRPVHLLRKAVRAALTPQRVAQLSALSQRLGLHGPLRGLYHRLRPQAAPPTQPEPGEALAESLSASERDTLQQLMPPAAPERGKEA